MLDLFGNEHPDAIGSAAPAKQLDLIDAAAERAALLSGRPKSQERADIVAAGGSASLPVAPRIGNKRHSHRCTRCGNASYCYKGGCDLPQRTPCRWC